MRRGGKAVEHHAEDLVLRVAQRLDVKANVLPVGAIESADVDHLFGALRDQEAVGDGAEGRRVDDDERDAGIDGVLRFSS